MMTPWGGSWIGSSNRDHEGVHGLRRPGRSDIFHFDKRYVHFDHRVTVYGDYLPPEESQEHKRPFRITYGYSKDKRPDLKQFVFATLCIDRAVPIWGQPEDGNALDKTVNNTLLSTIATLAQHGVAPGAYIYVADAALVTEDNLAALGDTLFISRLPATYNECGRLIAEAVAHHRWEELPRPRPDQADYAPAGYVL